MGTTNTSITLSWVEQFDGLREITGARLEYTEMSPSSTTQRLDVGRRAATLIGLTPFTIYRVTLFLKNRLGFSQPVSILPRTDSNG